MGTTSSFLQPGWDLTCNQGGGGGYHRTLNDDRNIFAKKTNGSIITCDCACSKIITDHSHPTVVSKSIDTKYTFHLSSCRS